MRYKVLLTDRAESDIDSALLWFREQRASDAGKRWFNLLTERIQTLDSIPSGVRLRQSQSTRVRRSASFPLVVDKSSIGFCS